MGVDAAVFETAGKRTEHYIPGSYVRSNNVTSPSGISASNYVILGRCSGGIPKKFLTFTSLSEAKEELIDGELLEAVAYAFNCSDDYIPSRVNVMRVNAGTQSQLAFGDLILKSKIYSTKGNLLKAKIENGTSGNLYKKLTVAYNDKESVVDDIYRPSLTIVGEGVTVSVDAEKLTVTKNGQVTELPFDTYKTLSEIVTRLNDVEGITEVILEDYTDGAMGNELDFVSSQDCSGGYTLCSTVQAIADAAETIGMIESVEIGENRILPESSATYKYFTGGADGDYTTAEWLKALEKLSVENVQIIATPSTDASVHTLIANHCAEMNKVEIRKERTCILGGTINATVDELLTKARALNSKFTSYVADTVTVANPISGKIENIPGAMLGVMLAAMESAMAINEPLTFKQIKVLGFGKIRTTGEIEKLIKGGVIVCNPNPENDEQNIVIRGVTTFQGRGDLISCERSMVREDIYMNRDIRNKFSLAIGRPNTGSTDDIIQTLRDAAAEWAIKGYIIPKGTSNVWDIAVSINGDKVYLTFSRYLTAPRNFVFITATNRIYTNTIEL